MELQSFIFNIKLIIVYFYFNIIFQSLFQSFFHTHFTKFLSLLIAQVCGGASHLSVWHLRSKTATATLPTTSSCQQVVKFVDDFILSAGTEPRVFKWSINGELRASFPCSPKSVFSLEINKTMNRVLAVSGTSHQMDISTNFDYKAFSLQFRQKQFQHVQYSFSFIIILFISFLRTEKLFLSFKLNWCQYGILSLPHQKRRVLRCPRGAEKFLFSKS